MSQINVNTIKNKSGTGGPNFPNSFTVTGVVTSTTFDGNVTGNVTGNVSGSSGSTTGNAATATALATGRTIGMTADVDFDTGESAPSTLIPTVAIVTEKGMPGVLVVGQNKQPRFQKVELGSSNGSKTAIVKGVKPGESIFINMPPWAKTKRD